MTLPPIDPTLCPLCGLANQCAMEIEKASGVAQPPCWCSRVQFDAALLASIPAAAQNLACLCPGCAQAVPHGVPPRPQTRNIGHPS